METHSNIYRFLVPAALVAVLALPSLSFSDGFLAQTADEQEPSQQTRQRADTPKEIASSVPSGGFGARRAGVGGPTGAGRVFGRAAGRDDGRTAAPRAPQGGCRVLGYLV